MGRKASEGWVLPGLAATGRGLCFVWRAVGAPKAILGTDITISTSSSTGTEGGWKRVGQEKRQRGHSQWSR